MACTYKNDSSAPKFDRIVIYRELSNQTQGVTSLGPYSLDQTSLFVDGYNEARPVPSITTLMPITTAPSQISAEPHFEVNLTMTSLKFTSDLADPASTKFNETQDSLTSLLNPLLKNTDLGPASSGCKVVSFRSANSAGDTAVSMACTYKNDSSAPKFDRIVIYRELSNQTQGVTSLGPYSLDQTSLFVDGYNEARPVPSITTLMPITTAPSQISAEPHFEVNLTLTSLKFTSDLADPALTKFNETQDSLTSLLNPLLKNTDLGPASSGCKVVSFRSANSAGDTAVSMACTYKNDSSAPKFDRIVIYRELSNKTEGVTSLGPYSLDQTSLFVDGYNEARPLPSTTTLMPITTAPSQISAEPNFEVNLTLTSLKFTSDLADSASTKFNETQDSLTSLLNPLLKNTDLGPASSGCKVVSFRSANSAGDTAVSMACTYKNDSSAPKFDRIVIYRELSNQTQGVTSLGPYSLDQTSLFVDGDH
ncbi:mucin-16-like [Ambystoma mexicanum]|uniref:mucin-16-like n=1 Tax=Ambystoma mexicanum TaxID=8296 RepID=UPI0037E9612B